jgi:rhodanese-related sulfurtransferase
MKQISMLLVMILSVTLTQPVHGGGFGSLTGAELKTLIDRGEPGLVIIDSRSASQFQESRITGATSLPLPDLEQDPTLPRVPKDARLVFYCSGNT